MKVIVGLGNPGREYEGTRHNAGWWFVDHLARHWFADAWRKDQDSVVADARVGAQRVRLVKPQTYMNLSGAALRPYLKRDAFDPAHDLLVVVDEVAVPAGEFRLRAAGSPGGHNGLKSIEAHVGSKTYPRLRLGIQPVDPRRHRLGDLADFVLRPMPRDERELLEGCFGRATEAVETWLRDGVEKAVSTLGR